MAATIIKRELTAAHLRELLSYDPDTGVFIWRNSIQGTKAGAIAGTSGTEGRRHITINYTRYKAHRLAWLYVYGEWPSKLIDHINGIPFDNRISNLREASMSENLCNQRKAHSRNPTGLIGAHWRPDKGKYRARISLHGQQKFLGYFDTAELAHAAYLLAKKGMHPFVAHDS